MNSMWYCYRGNEKLGPYSDEQMNELINSQQFYDDDDFVNEHYTLSVLSLEEVKGCLLQLKTQGDSSTGYPEQDSPYPLAANPVPPNTPIGYQPPYSYGQQGINAGGTKSFCLKCGKRLMENEAFCLRCGAPKVNTVQRNPVNKKRKNKPVIIVMAVITATVLVGVLFTAKNVLSKFTVGINDLKQEIAAATIQVSFQQEESTTKNKQTQEKQKTAKKKTIYSVGKGSFKGRIYNNDDLEFKYTIPQGFVVGSNEDVSKLNQLSGYYIKPLVMTSRYKVGLAKSYNDNSILMVDKIPSGQFTSEEYVNETKKMMVSLNRGYKFNKTTMKTINSIKFATVHAAAPGYMQDFYVTTRYGYYVIFINTYNSNGDKAIFNKMMSSIKFS